MKDPRLCCRSKEFNFERPKPAASETLSNAVGVHQAQHMKKVVEERVKELGMLQNQLMKANSENVALIKELEGLLQRFFSPNYIRDQ